MFIKLTTDDDIGTDLYLNTSNIVYFSTQKYFRGQKDNLTTVGIMTAESVFLVKETPEEIMKLIEEANNGL